MKRFKKRIHRPGAVPVIPRPPATQLAHLDSLLGVGQGAKKERARVNAKLGQ